MNPRIATGKGITGALRYVQGEGRDPLTNEIIKLAPGQKSRATLIGSTGFGFQITIAADVEKARRTMEFLAANQGRHKTRKCRQVSVHLVLSWAKGQNPGREEKNETAQSALDALGMTGAMSLIYEHSDEDYVHIHIIALGINPATRNAYNLNRSYRKLSAWALQYEIDHGGVINTRRQAANELRQAIARRDAGGVLEALTKQRATFTPAQLTRAIHKEIHWKTGDAPAQKAAVEAERSRFEAEIAAHPEIAGLADEPGGPLARYTTRTVLEAEGHVLHAAERLAASSSHACGEDHQARIEASDKYRSMTAEQLNAFLRATGPEGLALIDGQAGTGKSFTIEAIRTAYEQAGYHVIGLAPTNIVKEDMKASGFGHAATVHAELFALANGRAAWSRDTVAIVDEAAMLDTKIMALLAASAAEAGAKLILAGDDRQLSSIDRGGMFGALKDRYGAAVLSEVKRQYKIDERRASEMMAEGNFHDALGIYEQKGAIRWTRTEREARAALIEQWAEDTAREPGQSRFVFAYTNDAVDELNAALRSIRQARGELGPEHEISTPLGARNLAVGDRIQFTANDRKQGIVNGAAGTIEAIDGAHLAVRLDAREPRTIDFDAGTFSQFRHGYAGTIYKGQGRTLDETYLFHTDHWRAAPGYVALTRHRAQARLFVARNTAKNLAELARQVARRDEQRAASQFFPVEPVDPVPPLSAAELGAQFAAGRTPRRPNGSSSNRPSNDNVPGRAAGNDNERQAFHQAMPSAVSDNAAAAIQPAAIVTDTEVTRARPGRAEATLHWPVSRPRHQTDDGPGLTEAESLAPEAAPARHQPAQPRRGRPPSGSDLDTLKGQIDRARHAPWIEFGPGAPAPSATPARAKHSGQPEYTADANMPPPAMAPPPRQDPPPKEQTTKPANSSNSPIRQQFGAAQRAVTSRGDPTEQALRRKRKQKEDGERCLISASRAMMERLARAARRTWKFFWERNTPAAPCQDMRLDPRYAAWYAADPDAGGMPSGDSEPTTPSRPDDCSPGDFPSLNL